MRSNESTFIFGELICFIFWTFTCKYPY